MAKVYLIGPMRGLPDWNFPAFDEAKKRWSERGHLVFSPADMCRALGIQLRQNENPWTMRAQPDSKEGKAHLKHVMLADIAAIYDSDLVAVLPKWEESVGSTLEVSLANVLGLDIYCAIGMSRMVVPQTPWKFIRGTGYSWVEELVG